jgi:thiol-disulfide isomerase/thioredoxin
VDSGFVRIALRGTDSGRDAFGAEVRLKTSAGILTKVKAGGSGFVSQSDPRLLFGLGSDGAAEWLDVTWPSGAIQRFAGPAAGSSILVVEGEDAPVELRERRYSLPDPLGTEARRWHALGLDPETAIADIEVVLLNGEKRRLSDLVGSGETLLLNLWATWCRPCAREMPELERIHQESGRRIRVVGLNLDHEMADERIEAFLNDLDVTYPVARIAPAALERLLGTTDPGVPLSLVLDDRLRPRELMVGWSEGTSTRLEKLTAVD